jgi:hypothetical protein
MARAPADGGKPDPAGVEGPSAHAGAGRCTVAQILAHGFYSSAVKNPFLLDLARSSARSLLQGAGGRSYRPARRWCEGQELLGHALRPRTRAWLGGRGQTEALRTPDDTVVFVTPETRAVIRKDQADCMGCLSHCGFSSWKDHDDWSTGRLADPRSFCIQKTLQDIAHGGDVNQNLMFAGHAAYRFKQDPFYSNNFTPTVKQLVDRILTGD